MISSAAVACKALIERMAPIPTTLIRLRQNRTLQSHILALFLMLTVAVQVGGLALINTIGKTEARKSIGEDLIAGALVFDLLLEQHADFLIHSARLMSADRSFRRALTTADRGTSNTMLMRYAKDIDASLLMTVGLDQRVLSDTRGTKVGTMFAFPSIIAEAEASHEASAMVVIDGRLHQLVVLPVLAPTPVAWLIIGFVVDDRVARELGRLTRLRVSFFSYQKTEGWRLQASTLSDKDRATLQSDLIGERFGERDQNGNAKYGENTITRIIALPSRSDDRVVVVLQEPLSSALEPFWRLRHELTLIALAGILVSIVAGIAISRRIARPVRELAGVARRIAAGDYSIAPPPSRVVEIGDLGAAFYSMRDAIASRESRITDLAYSDALTQLPNRALYNDRLDQAIASAERNQTRVAVLLMDLDHFKYVNDTLGHAIGDLILCAVASRLEEVLKRRTDTVARLGGDEFGIVLPGDDAPAARSVANAILRSLEMPMTPEGHNLDVRASIGIAVYPEHGKDRSILLRHADVAMYAAKRNKLGCAMWNDNYDQYSRERLMLMNDLHRAVDKDELVLVYQPKVSLNGVGQYYAEALVRWQHSVRGLVMPQDFIPFAEQTGYIRAITQWVLGHAVAQCAQWRREELPINISINISAHDLMDAELPERFAAQLEQHGCAAEWTTLEITESGILEDPGYAIKSLERLSELGCRLALDDYGTGYSSLAYLRHLPLRELKLDKSFVMGMKGDKSDALIVRSTIDLAHNLGLSVTAEGVEDEATLDGLCTLRCDAVQGSLLSGPLEANELAAWMRGSAWTRIPHGATGLRRVV